MAPHNVWDIKFGEDQSGKIKRPVCNNCLTEAAYAQSSFNGKSPTGFVSATIVNQDSAINDIAPQPELVFDTVLLAEFKKIDLPVMVLIHFSPPTNTLRLTAS
jgi:hypothetical protein